MSTIARFDTDKVVVISNGGSFTMLVQTEKKHYYKVHRHPTVAAIKGIKNTKYKTIDDCIKSLGIVIFANVHFGERVTEAWIFTYYGANWFPIGILSSLQYRGTIYYWIFQDLRSNSQAICTYGNLTSWFVKKEEAMEYINSIKLDTGILVKPKTKNHYDST
jgi:hypothetical protein